MKLNYSKISSKKGQVSLVDYEYNHITNDHNFY